MRNLDPEAIELVLRVRKGNPALTQKFQMVSGTLGKEPIENGRLRGDVAFAGVTFAYKPGESVLHGLTTRIPAGTAHGLPQAMPAQVDHWYSFRILHGSCL